MPTCQGSAVGMVEGTIVEMRDVPPHCNIETIEFVMRTGRIHDIQLITPETTYRLGQAKERFEVSVQNMLSHFEC